MCTFTRIHDDKTIHSLQTKIRKKKRCDFQQKMIKYGRHTENRQCDFMKLRFGKPIAIYMKMGVANLSDMSYLLFLQF